MASMSDLKNGDVFSFGAGAGARYTVNRSDGKFVWCKLVNATGTVEDYNRKMVRTTRPITMRESVPEAVSAPVASSDSPTIPPMFQKAPPPVAAPVAPVEEVSVPATPVQEEFAAKVIADNGDKPPVKAKSRRRKKS